MLLRMRPLAALAFLLLPLASHAQAPGFSCPPAGLEVRLSDGRIILQQGAERLEPLLCLRQTTRPDLAPVQERYWLNAIQEGEPDQRDARRAAVASLLPFRQGAEARFNATRTDGQAIAVTFRVQDIAEKTLPAGRFTVLSLLEESSFPAGKIVGLHGLDLATGTYLSFWGEFQMGGMHTRAIESQATAITPAAAR
jgi:hypothetical protein